MHPLSQFINLWASACGPLEFKPAPVQYNINYHLQYGPTKTQIFLTLSDFNVATIRLHYTTTIQHPASSIHINILHIWMEEVTRHYTTISFLFPLFIFLLHSIFNKILLQKNLLIKKGSILLPSAFFITFSFAYLI